MKLSIIIPCYNEKTISEIENQILNVKGISKEIIIIDDNSTDGSKELLKNKISKNE